MNYLPSEKLWKQWRQTGMKKNVIKRNVKRKTKKFFLVVFIMLPEMITILRRRVARNIWVATLKVKVTAWPCSKIVSGL